MKARVLGINTDWARPNAEGRYGAVGWYRLINPLSKIGATVLEKGIELLPGPEMALKLKQMGEIWVTKPIDSPEVVLNLLANRDFTGCKLVFDLDDHPFVLNEKHPLYEKLKGNMPVHKMLFQGADHIIVSSERIKDVVKGINPHVTVIPNSIDPEIWKVKRKHRKDGRVRIGWFGSASHLADMPIVLEFMKEILIEFPNVEFHMAGFVYEESREERVYHYSGTKGYAEYPQWVSDKDLDIAIAPLVDSEFNRAKSNIKWLEHSMLETPMVLSKVGPYKESVVHGKTGFLAENKKDWKKYLKRLIQSKELREKIGKEAKKAVEKDYLVEKQLPKYEKLFDRLTKKDITVYTAVSGDFDTLAQRPDDDTANYIAFTSSPNDWDVNKRSYQEFKSDRRNSRIQKIMPHLYFNTEYSIYLDGNISLKVPAETLVKEWLKEKDIAVFRHIGRDCVYEEAGACVQLKKGKPEELSEQCKHYAEWNHPKHAGLYECGVIVRRHTKRINDLNEKWWAHYCRFSERDQMSFAFVFPKEEINGIESSVWRHKWFDFKGH